MPAANLEIERKFRLRAAPAPDVLAAHGAVATEIEQVYLLRAGARPGRERAGDAERVRRLTAADGTVTFRHTVKRRVGRISFDERESVIDEAAWRAALTRSDPDSKPIRKTRHVVPHGAQKLEIDVFEQPAGLVVLEVELASEEEAVELPGWLGEWREVTGDRAYFNASLARSGTVVPPWG